MKINRFKIRNVPFRVQESSHLETPIENQIPAQHPANKEIFDQLQALLKKTLEQNAISESGFDNLEYRDRLVKCKVRDSNDAVSTEAWIGEVCRNVISTTFHHYLNENMTFEQAKIYCCEEVLRNIAEFVEKHEVEADFYHQIDKVMKEKVMPYLALKYPLSESLNVNRTLNRYVRQINNIEVLSNDFFFNSNLVLEYRSNGNYNDIIMRVLNEIISLADSVPTQTQADDTTVFKEFDNYITSLFERVYDPVWMTQKKRNPQLDLPDSIEDGLKNMISQNIIKELKGGQEAEKYKQKVQEYTHYEIGRKIPQSVPCYTEDQIKSKHLLIKSPEILRIMTKWCEELWDKFENENYYIDRSEGLTMLNSKQINILYEWLRLALKAEIKQEKNRIKHYMENIENNLYQQEFKILQSQLLSKEAPFLSRYQRICGKFSVKVVNNLKNCITIYLNRIIHGLMSVSEKLFQGRMRGMPSWPSAPNLLSFKIGDLLRCRISSQEKQIIKLYEELQYLSDNNPEQLRIIRVKNRLKSGTNDLLVNVRFNNKFIAQIQLKVKSKVGSRFSHCSYNFSHFIYEIQRSYFGPISEFCSIWANLDSRTQLYNKLVNNEKLELHPKKDSYSCQQDGSNHALEIIMNSPFVCSGCGKFFSSDNYYLAHKRCRVCKSFVCCLCQTKERQSTDLIDQILIDESIKEKLHPQRCDIVPKLGIYVRIQNNSEGQANLFKTIGALEKSYIFILKNNETVQIVEELKTDNDRNRFLKDNLVYEYLGAEHEEFVKLDIKKALTKYITPSYVANCYRIQKEAISLNKVSNVAYDVKQIESMLKDPKDPKKCVKQLEVSSHNLLDIDFIPQELSNLELINVNLNRVKDIEGLSKFKRLQTLFCLSNQLETFPVALCSLPLKFVSVAQNKLTTFPDELQKLEGLEVVRFNQNNMSELPLPVIKLKNVKQIYAENNKIKSIPQEISNCTKLKILNLSTNQIVELNDGLLQLASLETLDLSSNKLQDITIQMKALKQLKNIKLVRNKFSKFPLGLNMCPSLQRLDISNNTLGKLELDDLSLDSLQQLILEDTKLTSLSSLHGFKNLTFLNLSNNNLVQLPADICQLKKLVNLNLNKNKLKDVPEGISELLGLKSLTLSFNVGIELPDSFSKLKLETLLLSDCSLLEMPTVLVGLKLLKELNMYNNKLRNLPSQINRLKSLEVLNCSQNDIAVFPIQIRDLRNIKKLVFKQRAQKLQNLDNLLPKCFQLEQSTLDLTKCKIVALPESLPTNRNIEKLDLKDNFLIQLPETIKNIVNLKEVLLNNNKLLSVCDQLFELKALQVLNLCNNELQALPERFHQLTKLKTLDISGNRFTCVPSSLKPIFNKNFKFFYSRNQIQTIPLWMSSKDSTSTTLKTASNFFCTADVQKLILELQLFYFYTSVHLCSCSRHNKIKQIPAAIAQLTKLKRLSLPHNLVTEIPEAVGNLTNLSCLETEANPLVKVHQSFQKHQKLALRFSLDILEALQQNQCIPYLRVQTLQLQKLGLKSVCNQLGSLQSVKNLYLQENCLTGFPDVILRLKGLQKLYLWGQPIRSIPVQIDSLSELVEMNISACELKQLPATLAKLSKLQLLDVSNNQLENLQEVTGLAKIVTLLASNNRLNCIPQIVYTCTSLRRVELQCNQIKQLSQAIETSAVTKLNLSHNLIKRVPQQVNNSRIQNGGLDLSHNPLEPISKNAAVINKFTTQTKKQLEATVNNEA